MVSTKYQFANARRAGLFTTKRERVWHLMPERYDGRPYAKSLMDNQQSTVHTEA